MNLLLGRLQLAYREFAVFGVIFFVLPGEMSPPPEMRTFTLKFKPHFAASKVMYIIRSSGGYRILARCGRIFLGTKNQNYVHKNVC